MAKAASLSDAELSVIFFEKASSTPAVNERQSEFERVLPELMQKLKKRGVTKKMVYEYYREHYPGGYKHSRFWELLNCHIGMVKPSGRIVHQAGDKLFVDFTGKKLHIVNKETGEVKPVEVFVSVLGCSQYTYVRAVASQKKKTLRTPVNMHSIFTVGFHKPTSPTI